MKFLVTLLASTCVANAALANEYRADGAAKVYTDGQGAFVTMVMLKPRKPAKVLLKITGTRGQFDDLVLLHDVNEMGTNRADFNQKWRGKDYTTLVVREAWASASGFELFPGGQKELRIYYDKAKSEALKADDIVKEYYNRRLEPLAAARSEAESKETKAVESKIGEMNQECGSQVKAAIDWKSVPEDALKNWNVAAGCGAVADAISNLCDDDVGKQTVKGKIKEISCRFGKKPEIAVSGGKVIWTLASDATDLREKAYSYLMEKL